MTRNHKSILFTVLVGCCLGFPINAIAEDKKCVRVSSKWTTIDSYVTTRKINYSLVSPYGRHYHLANGIWFGQKRLAAKKEKFTQGTTKSVLGAGRLKVKKADGKSDFEICYRVVDLLQDDPR